ncbi:MAG: GDSL-type esterase/lipase family protein [Actinomycetota bacterium]|nr:GDSL-type esterase/lipase family protein [Actinomycetota bacterium]
MTVDLRIAALGDSFVAGVGDSDFLGWVGRLARRYRCDGAIPTLYLLGVRRETTADVLRRARRELDPRLLPTTVNAVILSTGVNDTQVENGAVRLSPNERATALHQLLQVTRDHGETLVVGPPPVSDDAHNQRIRRLSHRMQEQCDDEGVPFVPVIDALLSNPIWMQEVAAGDGSHPGPRGYEIMTQIVESSNSWANFCSRLRLHRGP